MKAILAIVVLVASVSSATALTTKYTSELEPYTSAGKVATLSEDEVRLALNYIAGNRSEGEKRAFIRRLGN